MADPQRISMPVVKSDAAVQFGATDQDRPWMSDSVSAPDIAAATQAVVTQLAEYPDEDIKQFDWMSILALILPALLEMLADCAQDPDTKAEQAVRSIARKSLVFRAALRRSLDGPVAAANRRVIGRNLVAAMAVCAAKGDLTATVLGTFRVARGMPWRE